MKKKTKIVGTIVAMGLSLCMLVFGVFAASTVSLNVSSTVSFNAQGVYLKAQGQVKRGTASGSTTNLEESSRPEGDVGSYSYLDYSYEEDTDGTPLGTVSQETMPDWTIGTILFDETNKVIEYVFNFTNYSEFDIEVNITATKDAVLTTVSGSETDNLITIKANGGTGSYTYTLTLNDVSTSINGGVGFVINANKYVPSDYNAPVTFYLVSLDFTLSVNEDSYNRTTCNNLNSLKEGDVVLIESSNGLHCNVTLYENDGQQKYSWNSNSLRTDPISFTVPKLNEGDRFVFGFATESGGSPS